MKKITLLSCVLFIFFSSNAQDKPVSVELADISYPILGMKISPSSHYLFLTLNGGRFLLYDISNGRLTENSHPIWTNLTINGFNLGGDAEFSDNEKYILVSEQEAVYARDRVKTQAFSINILDVANGNVVFETANVNSAQFLNDNESVFIVTDDGIYIYNLKTKIKGAIIPVKDCETGCLNNAEDMLAVSYDASSSEFREAAGAGNNKKEIRNAVRNKKLIAFYDYPSMKKAGITNEEVDVVFRMQFTSDDKYLLFFSRTRQMEHDHVNVLNGLDKTRDLNQFQRVSIEGFVVDNLNFIHQTSEQLANFDVNQNEDLFVYSDNRGTFSNKREVMVTKFSEQISPVATYTFQGRARTRNLFSTAFAIVDPSNVLVANGLKMTYWDYTKFPFYTDYIEPVDENAILDKATEQLDNELESQESSLYKSISRKNIKGLYLFNITIQKNGEVLSIFALSDEKTNIPMQNSLKDLILKYKFDVSIPKNQRLKFTYTFNLQ